MRGTWQTEGGGLAAAAAAGTAAGAGAIAAGFIFARIWWVLAVTAACGVLSVAAALGLWRWSGRQTARARDRRPAELPQLPRIERPAIAPQVVNIFNFGADATRAAAVIRQAIEGGGDHDGRGSR
jgi:hypothetical protein